MTHRRDFLKTVVLGAGAATMGIQAGTPVPAPAANSASSLPPEPASRAGWMNLLCRISTPVLENLAANTLRKNMPVECVSGKEADRRTVTYLETLGRTLDGLAPWLELQGKPETESARAKQLAEWARTGLDHATDSSAPDFMNFTNGGQPLVDAAFLAQAFLRSPNELWGKLTPAVQQRTMDCLKQTRSIKPYNSNWLLFSAMVEAFLASVQAEWKPEPIDLALSRFKEWYKGDGCYSDGPSYHWDYYNSIVIQPFLVDILETMAKATTRWNGMLGDVKRRAERYSDILEKQVAPDGSFPAVGRSLAYRCGVYHLLAQSALLGRLPHNLPPGQAREALNAVIHRTLDAPGTWDDKGWLQIGLCGHQPGIGEHYISTGSLYLCTFAFLPLGLPPGNLFWTSPALEWTSRKVWSSQNVPADHAGD